MFWEEEDGRRFGFRCAAAGALVWAAFWFWFASQLLKTLSAAVIVGSSLLAGVAVFDLVRRVDLPKEPVSWVIFLERKDPSCL
jgi:hypothetical protein